MPKTQKPVDQPQAKTLNSDTKSRLKSQSSTSIHGIDDDETSMHLPARIEGKPDGTDFMVKTWQGRCQQRIPRTFDRVR
jgi:hypothetical protein